MPARASYTAVSCASVADAGRLANLLAASWPGPGPKPDLVEANNAEVDLTWFTVQAAAPFAAVASVAAANNVSVKSSKHNNGQSNSSS
jgi:hypothetical protein